MFICILHIFVLKKTEYVEILLYCMVHALIFSVGTPNQVLYPYMFLCIVDIFNDGEDSFAIFVTDN